MYVAEVVGCSPACITAVSRFDYGNRHAVFKVAYLGPDTKDVVVRVSFAGGPAEHAQAAREASVLSMLGGLAAPRLYDFHATSAWFETPVMCMEFVPGHAQDLGSAAPQDLEQLGRVVAALHHRPLDAGDIASYAEQRFESILAGLAWVRAPLPVALQERLRRVAGALETAWEAWREADCFRTEETLAVLHGDIGPGNVLWSPDPVLIDWEYTRPGDPADEIAYLLDQNGLTAPRREAFWRGYPHEARLVQRVDWWERLTLLGSALWWVERWVRRTDADAAGAADPHAPREPAYYLGHVTSRLDRVEAFVQAARAQ